MLSRVQLALPVLEREKQALLAELEAIQKQHQEEKRRNHDLLARLHRLNQQFTRIGTPQVTRKSLLRSCPDLHKAGARQRGVAGFGACRFNGLVDSSVSQGRGSG